MRDIEPGDIVIKYLNKNIHEVPIYLRISFRLKGSEGSRDRGIYMSKTINYINYIKYNNTRRNVVFVSSSETITIDEASKRFNNLESIFVLMPNWMNLQKK